MNADIEGCSSGKTRTSRLVDIQQSEQIVDRKRIKVNAGPLTYP